MKHIKSFINYEKTNEEIAISTVLGGLAIARVVKKVYDEYKNWSAKRGLKETGRTAEREDGIIFRQEYLEQAEKFYEKHGGKTIIMARFVPIVRTFAPVVAGAGKMPRGRFMFFNVFGGMLWGAGMPLLGYFVGNRIPHLDKYIEVVMIAIILASFGLALLHLLKDKTTRQKFLLLSKQNYENQLKARPSRVLRISFLRYVDTYFTVF